MNKNVCAGPYFPHEKHTMPAASVHLDYADEENGCLRVIPGSHQMGILPHIGIHYLNQKDYPVKEGIPCVVLFQYRDATDFAADKNHINWGMGLMVCGENPNFTQVKPDYQIV